jgi:alcohol dehydrogenase (cytochrome c)
MYFPLHNICMGVTTIANPDAIEGLYGFSTKYQISPGTDKVGVVQAISVETGASVWRHEQRAGTLSLVATGGGLVFGGDANGRFRAFDDKSGKVLWETNLGSPVSGYPVTFSVDGKQYVAVSTGPSLVAGAAIRLTPELRPSEATQMYVFALP